MAACARWFDEMQGDLTRRSCLRRLVVLGGVAPLTAFPQTARALEPGEAIPQPDKADGRAFMDRAFEMKRRAEELGDQSYGAAVIKDGRIVGQAPSRVVLNSDPTGHAEMEAIRDAARRLGTRDLSGCVLYSSSRACPMCEAGAYWAGISLMYYGRGITPAGRPRLARC